MCTTHTAPAAAGVKYIQSHRGHHTLTVTPLVVLLSPIPKLQALKNGSIPVDVARHRHRNGGGYNSGGYNNGGYNNGWYNDTDYQPRLPHHGLRDLMFPGEHNSLAHTGSRGPLDNECQPGMQQQHCSSCAVFQV